ncbi:MAG: energy transducer TonB [Acidobacteriia bacterium]|nr:energy transducer TonB [Terriglobia bacterium]
MRMFPHEVQSENSLEPLPLPPASEDTEVQRKRMLIALGILLVALAGAVLKDWDFWFPPGSEGQEAAIRSHGKGKSVAAVTTTAPAAHARERKPAKSPAPASTAVPFLAATERAALPPLQVEVVAGNRHISVPGKSNAIDVDVNSGQTSSASSAPAAANAPVDKGTVSGRTVSGRTVNDRAVNAGDRVQLSPQTAQSVSVSVPPDYPLLARQMKVQGAVSLQALISRDGTIQELQILSGPGILAAAAREAVKQWHFKPYLQNGRPVETQAKITVNFTISTN